MNTNKKLLKALSVIALSATCALCGCTPNNPTNPSEPSLTTEEVFEDSVELLRSRLNLDNYRKNEQQQIESIINQAISAFETSYSVEAIQYLLPNYITMLDQVPEKTSFESWEQDEFIELIQMAKDNISTYKNLSAYRGAEQTTIREYISDAKEELDGAHTLEEIQTIEAKYKSMIDALKTNYDYQMEEEEQRQKLEDCKSTAQIDRFKQDGYKNLYEDPNYKDGYIVTKPFYGEGESPYHDKYLKTYPSFNTPKWTIAQWTSRYDLLGDDPNTSGYTLNRQEYGLINTYTSKGKMVNGEFVPGKVITANSITGELYLESNCSVEYEQHRTGSEGWVHLLYSQDFGHNLINVKNCSSIMMDASFTVNKCINHMGDAYNSNKHAAQLVWYITIQNRNKKSAGYGRYIWFGIGLWDNRTPGTITSPYIAHDAGTDTLIYNPSSSTFYKETNGVVPQIGQKGHANIDIRPIVQQVFEESVAKGYLQNTNFEDLYIGGTNFGYEVPGTFDIGATIHEINVFYK